jgi:phenylacetate-coenzyme A ligase PaaK-like adenylate-forming protein
MVAGGLPYADGLRRIGATLAWLGGFPTERILRALPRLQASAILATTSFGVYLSDHCRQLIGCAPSELGVRKFLSGGEPGLGQPEIRAKISACWARPTSASAWVSAM